MNPFKQGCQHKKLDGTGRLKLLPVMDPNHISPEIIDVDSHQPIITLQFHTDPVFQTQPLVHTHIPRFLLVTLMCRNIPQIWIPPLRTVKEQILRSDLSDASYAK